MPDVTIVGGGRAARGCAEVLTKAGFSLRHAFEPDPRERCPVILGEVANSFALARDFIAAGRHLLIADPSGLKPARLALLFEGRRRAQAVFVWQEQRYHPGYRFLTGLIEADATWRPRYVRLETLSTEQTSASATQWRLLERLITLETIVTPGAASVRGTGVFNHRRQAFDLVEASIDAADMQVFLRVGLGEAVERREMLLAAPARKAYVDELNQSVPIRLVNEETEAENRGGSRWLSCSAPTPDELVRQQCLAFLEATLHATEAQKEAEVWCNALGTLSAIEESLHGGSSPVVAVAKVDQHPFRLLEGRRPRRLLA